MYKVQINRKEKNNEVAKKNLLQIFCKVEISSKYDSSSYPKEWKEISDCGEGWRKTKKQELYVNT